MKQLLRPVFLCALVSVLALGLAACGQRMDPPAPAGKITPSSAY